MNVRSRRALARFSQDQLAKRMQDLGHGWVRATVSQVELNQRNVSVDELVSLSLLLGQSIGDLLDPAGVDGRGKDGLDYGGGVLDARFASQWARGRIWAQLEDDGQVAIEPVEDFSGTQAALDAFREPATPKPEQKRRPRPWKTPGSTKGQKK